MDVSSTVQSCACDAYWSLDECISVLLVDSDGLLQDCWCETKQTCVSVFNELKASRPVTEDVLQEHNH